MQAHDVEFASGSSPHTRGARKCHTPKQCVMEDHPRIRGEHEDGEPWFVASDRIIPAYAGSTPKSLYIGTKCAGSSPHTRGALNRLFEGQDVF